MRWRLSEAPGSEEESEPFPEELDHHVGEAGYMTNV